MRTGMFNATRTLLLAPRRRVLPHLPAVLQAAAAAVGAWYLALALLPTERPAFASIAAVICLGVTHGQRRRRATELIGGVVVGIGVASVLLYVIGTGPLQIGLLVILAMSAALLLRGGELLVNEAAISAILLASLQQTDAGFSADRILEGLIGGGVGLVIASLLLPPDPVVMVSRVAQARRRQARAHARGGRRGARRPATRAAPSRRCTPRAGSTTTSTRSRRSCPSRSTRRASRPTRRGDRELLRRYEQTMPQVDFAVRNARVLARYVLRHTRGPERRRRGWPRRCASSPRRSGSSACSTSEPERPTRAAPAGAQRRAPRDRRLRRRPRRC